MCVLTPVTQIFLLVRRCRSKVLLSNMKGELVQPQLFRATPHSSHTLLNHWHLHMENPTPSPPLRCAVPVHASPSIALPNPFINKLQFAKLAAPLFGANRGPRPPADGPGHPWMAWYSWMAWVWRAIHGTPKRPLARTPLAHCTPASRYPILYLTLNPKSPSASEPPFCATAHR